MWNMKTLPVYLSAVLVGLVDGVQTTCIQPKGSEGDSYTEGCLIQTCTDGSWVPDYTATATSCCYDEVLHSPGATITSATAIDNCTVATLHCATEGGSTKWSVEVDNKCTEHLTEIERLELEKKVEASQDTAAALQEKMDGVEAKVEQLKQLLETEQQDDSICYRNVTRIKGVLVTGGMHILGNKDSYLKSSIRGYTHKSEVYLPSSGKTCPMPSVPGPRYHHTMDTLDNTPVICGGAFTYSTTMSCIQLSTTSVEGVWTDWNSTTKERTGHASWVSSEGLVLIGGDYSPFTAEIVPPPPGRDLRLKMRTKTRTEFRVKWACLIEDGNSTIITGGKRQRENVRRFDLQGPKWNKLQFLEDLPKLNEGRWAHGCGSYHSGNTKVLIVAGGQNGGTIPTASTEKFVLGSTAWSSISPLPRGLYGLASVSLDSGILVTGGWDNYRGRTEILQFDAVEEDWKEVGNLAYARWYHAATIVDVDTYGLCG